MKYLSIMSFFLIIFYCKQIESYSYPLNENVNFKFNIKELEFKKNQKSTFLYFTLQINNNDKEEVYFDPSLLKVEVNGKVNLLTFYNSLASVMPDKVKLNKGINIFNLYFVFQGKINSIQGFNLSESGITK